MAELKRVTDITADGGVSARFSDEGGGIGKVHISLIDQPLMVCVSDESTPITTGTTKISFPWPVGARITGLRATLNDASSSGAVVFDINVDGTSILDTKLTVGEGDFTSDVSAIPHVVGDQLDIVPNGSVITIDIDEAGSGATGAKITFWFLRVVMGGPGQTVYTSRG